MRSAECFGAHGIVIPARRSVGVTDTVVKVSSGATEHMAIAKVTNLNDAIRELRRDKRAQRAQCMGLCVRFWR